MQGIDKDLITTLIATIIAFTAIFAIGYINGLTYEYEDIVVIRSVNFTNNGPYKYLYETDQFYFRSDSTYQVGDTLLLHAK